MRPEYEHDHFCAGGERVEPHSSRSITVVSPSTEQPVGRVPDCDERDVDTAVRAARTAFEAGSEWRSWSAGERAAVMDRLADELDRRGEELAVLMAHEIGRPISSRGGSRAGEILRYFAGLARGLVAEDVRPSPDARGPGGLSDSLVCWEPRGVTGAIAPYNGTLILGMYKIAPTLAAGGTVVLKPPPQAPLEAYVLMAAAEAAGLPPGVVNIAPGGGETGAALVRHPGVDMVGFTGSTAVGRRIAAMCGEALKPVTLELGGKSAAVVLQDADLSRLERALPFIGFTFTGQNCFVHSRIIVQRSRYEEVVELLARVAKGLRVGDPFDPETELGPVISSDHRDAIEAHVRRAVDDGARVVAGGRRPDSPQQGWYVEPTILTDVTPQMAIAREEVFGPVLAVLVAEDDEHAIRLANDGDFGLGGSVWSADEERALQVACRVDTGSIGVNGFGFNSAAPFSCRRSSGLGTELGPEGLQAYLQPRVIHRFGGGER